MTDSIVVLEHVTRVTPLGLRFLDGATGRVIGSGLEVQVAPASTPDRRTQALPNRIGIFHARGLPGLADVERGSGNAAFWTSPPVQRDFNVTVTDRERRFLSCQFVVTLPAFQLAVPTCLEHGTPSSPTPTGIPLFSAPARPAPGGMAVVRVEVQDDRRPGPAPWALIEVDGAHLAPAQGVTDEQGRGMVVLPYPEPALFGIGSPPSGGMSLMGQHWNLTLRIYATPQAWAPIPDLCHIVQQAAEPPRATVPFTLRYGEEAIIRAPAHGPLRLPTSSPL